MQYKKDAFLVTQIQILNAVEIYIITNLNTVQKDAFLATRIQIFKCSREWYDAFLVTRINKYSQRTKAYYNATSNAANQYSLGPRHNNI